MSSEYPLTLNAELAEPLGTGVRVSARQHVSRADFVELFGAVLSRHEARELAHDLLVCAVQLEALAHPEEETTNG